MPIIGFDGLYTEDFHIHDIVVIDQKHWQEGKSFTMATPRRTDALLFFRHCAADYILEDGTTFFVPRKSLIFIPRGSIYKTVFRDCTDGKIRTQLLEFSLLSSKGTPLNVADKITILEDPAGQLARESFDKLSSLSTTNRLPMSALRAEIYRLLSGLGQIYYRKNMFSPRFAPIAKGILFIENNVASDASIEDIARMCHVSPAYFRKRFHQYAGMSPAQYRTERKIEHAKRLLGSGTMTISEVAFTLGFDDPSYFSKVFKKITGTTPGSVNK